MFRIILVILLALVAFRLLKNLFRSREENSRRMNRNGSTGSPQEMVSCNRCGTFIVKSNAIFNGSNYYCSEGCWKGH